jgi:hypothetical protein
VGTIKDATGSMAMGLYILALTLGLGGILVLAGTRGADGGRASHA